MIDLDQIGYNVLQNDPNVTSDGGTEITGGLTLTVRIKIASPELAPDPQAIILHVKKRIREKIWEMAYGHLREPMIELHKAMDMADPAGFGFNACREGLNKLEKAIGTPDA